MENIALVDPAAIPDLYLIFTFELLQNLFLSVSKLVKDGKFQYLSSYDLLTYVNGPRRKQRLFSFVRTPVIRGYNTLLSEFEK